jgi:hypothetical protein
VHVAADDIVDPLVRPQTAKEQEGGENDCEQLLGARGPDVLDVRAEAHAASVPACAMR